MTFFDSDNNNDRTPFLENEIDLGLDLFSCILYFSRSLDPLCFMFLRGLLGHSSPYTLVTLLSLRFILLTGL
jgi:hypothetical protein